MVKQVFNLNQIDGNNNNSHCGTSSTQSYLVWSNLTINTYIIEVNGNENKETGIYQLKIWCNSSGQCAHILLDKCGESMTIWYLWYNDNWNGYWRN